MRLTEVIDNEGTPYYVLSGYYTVIGVGETPSDQEIVRLLNDLMPFNMMHAFCEFKLVVTHAGNRPELRLYLRDASLAELIDDIHALLDGLFSNQQLDFVFHGILYSRPAVVDPAFTPA